MRVWGRLNFMEYLKYINFVGNIIFWKDDILEVICIFYVYYFIYKRL